MKKILIYLSIIPYKTVKLPTGLIVKHYRNGKLIADERDTRYGK
jgi:hypothetical protein